MQFTHRIIGLHGGSVVFDGSPERLDEEALTAIYGDENWDTLTAQEAEVSQEVA
jgi:phosphonate transport system ATP-binding protein